MAWICANNILVNRLIDWDSAKKETHLAPSAIIPDRGLHLIIFHGVCHISDIAKTRILFVMGSGLESARDIG